MANFRDINFILFKAGLGASFSKIDWTSAYKHLGNNAKLTQTITSITILITRC